MTYGYENPILVFPYIYVGLRTSFLIFYIFKTIYYCETGNNVGNKATN